MAALGRRIRSPRRDSRLKAADYRILGGPSDSSSDCVFPCRHLGPLLDLPESPVHAGLRVWTCEANLAPVWSPRRGTLQAVCCDPAIRVHGTPGSHFVTPVFVGIIW